MKRSLFFVSVLIILAALTGMAKAPDRKVYVQTLENGHYRLIVEGGPYIVKGVCYNPVPIGEGYDYNFWNDPREPWKKDGALMEKMGINTVRFYHPAEDLDATKRVVSDLYELYGIRTIMGHWLGFWNYPAPFYDSEEFRNNVKKEVLAMVKALKDEEGILFWALGNENNYSFGGKINPWSSERIDKVADPRQCMLMRAEVYYAFVNELAREIHRIDPDHPVVMGNGELVCLDVANEFAPDVDIVGCVIYRGKTFGNIFRSLKATYDKPLLFIEFGCDAYNALEKREDQDVQADFLRSQWSEIYKNLADGATSPAAGSSDGAGNCLGGTVFEWNDEWWKHDESNISGWSAQDTESNWSNGAYYFDIKAERNMNMNEEWFGLVRLEKDDGGLDKRVPRKAYYVLREFWKNPHDAKKNRGR